ncbi:BatA domain-containing protein [Flagellimonas aequoris]|nr:BatA domain-containing protein [Allomuricauda aequoris]
MQFKHPEILWALFLLIIPLFIHLFQLRRFQKTPFTNVAMLQKVVSESRKSNSLKKWLLLFTRLLLLVALILAFAQPFVSSGTALQQKETVVYLDDSFSMQAKDNGLALFEKAIQDLIKNVDEESVFSLFTNTQTFTNIQIKDIQNNLLSLPYTYKQLTLDEIGLKANTLFSKSNSSVKNLMVISDFQDRMAGGNTLLDSMYHSYFVPLRPREAQNVSMDSVFLSDRFSDQAKLTVLLSGGNPEEALPLSLYNDENLIAKTAAKFGANAKARVEFSIPGNKKINGRLTLVDNGLAYDNTFYFNINETEKIKVLAISESDNDYLSRLYTEDEFDLQNYRLNQLDYSKLDDQNVVILDNLKAVPNSLQNVLRTFKNNGGTLIVIPSISSDLASYNSFLSSLSNIRFTEKVSSNTKLTTIAFDHPLYRNVFEKQVTNFQYPSVKEYFKVQTNLPNILALEGGDAFLLGKDGLYIFSTPLELENSNFKNSPLIVPTFYNMAISSLKAPELYHTLGVPSAIDVATRLGSDDILSVAKEGYEFIPLQQTFPNRVRLSFDQNPTEDGIYTISENGNALQNISFNYPRAESQLSYMDLESFSQTNIQDSVVSVFRQLEQDNNITAYWKWFVILALLLALTEVIIQKFVT